MAETFGWCPAPGASRQREPRLAELGYGDGYSHRTTSGINIMRDSWSLTFASDEPTLEAIDAFLSTNAVPGFWWQPPHEAAEPAQLFVCDSWTLTWNDKGRDGLLLGSIAAVFRRSYNTQPGGAMP